MASKLYHPAQKAEPSMEIEMLFNSVEVELARRWAFGEVPIVFASRPVEDLCKMVKQWWNIYQDSVAAAAYQNRQTWERKQPLSMSDLDTPALVASLQQIRMHINLEAINGFRPLHEWETNAIYLLGMITGYYLNLNKQHPSP